VIIIVQHLNGRTKMEVNPTINDEQQTDGDGFDRFETKPYFVTICTHGRQPTLGTVHEGQMVLNVSGDQVEEEWLRTGERFTGLKLDAYIIMPNHFHAILWLSIDRTSQIAARAKRAARSKKDTDSNRVAEEKYLTEIVDNFKAAVTDWANSRQHSPGNPFWQPGYHGHVIGSSHAVPAMRRYVHDNPVNWSRDIMNPQFGDPSCLIPPTWTSSERA